MQVGPQVSFQKVLDKVDLDNIRMEPNYYHNISITMDKN